MSYMMISQPFLYKISSARYKSMGFRQHGWTPVAWSWAELGRQYHGSSGIPGLGMSNIAMESGHF